MNSPRIRAGAVLIGAIMLSTVSAVAEDDGRLDPPFTEAPVDCRTSVDPGFIQTIEDRSNDKGFFAQVIDISNDRGFLRPDPVQPPPAGGSRALCPPALPFPEPSQP